MERQRACPVQTERFLEVSGRRKTGCAVLSGNQGRMSVECSRLSAVLEPGEAHELLRDAGAVTAAASLLPVWAWH